MSIIIDEVRGTVEPEQEAHHDAAAPELPMTPPEVEAETQHRDRMRWHHRLSRLRAD